MRERNDRSLVRDVLKAAEFGAKAEALDADLKRGAVAL